MGESDERETEKAMRRAWPFDPSETDISERDD